MDRLQCKTVAYSDCTRGKVTPSCAAQVDVKRASRPLGRAALSGSAQGRIADDTSNGNVPSLLLFPTPHRISNVFSELAALTCRAGQRKFVQIQGPQHHSDVKSRVVAVMGSLEQTGAVNMIPTTRRGAQVSTLPSPPNSLNGLVEALEETGSVAVLEGSRPTRYRSEFSKMGQQRPACKGLADGILGERITA